jgi:hypothetical protein
MEKLMPQKQAHRRWWLISIIIVVTILVLYAVLALIVNLTKPNGFFRSVIKLIPVPVAMINWQPVWANDLYQQAAGLKQAQAYMTTTTSSSSETDETIFASAFTKSIKDVAASKLLKKNDLKVSVNDVEQSYNNEATQSGSSQTVENSIKRVYGWSPALFKKYVVRINLIRERLREKFAYSPSFNSAAKTTAGQVLALVKQPGSDFSELAKKYSQDEYATKGGDMGFVSQGTMAKEIEDVAWELNVGQVSDVIQSEYGFHIIKLLAKKSEAGSSQLNLLEIFIGTPTVETAITDYLQKTTIRIFTRGYEWQKSTQQIVAD